MIRTAIISAAALAALASPALGNVRGDVTPQLEGSAECATASATWHGYASGGTYTRTWTVTVNGSPVAGSTETFAGRGPGVDAHSVTAPVNLVGTGTVAVYAALGPGVESLVAERTVTCPAPVTPAPPAPGASAPAVPSTPPFIGTPPRWPATSTRKPPTRRPPARPRYRCPLPSQIVVIRRVGNPPRSVRTCVKPPPPRRVTPPVAG